MKINKTILSVLKVAYFLLMASLIGLTVRLLFFLSVVVPSNSMEPSIFAGDYLLVNKCVPGLRSCKFDSVKKCPEIVRKFRTGTIRRGDILVFNFPYHDHDVLSFDSKLHYIKRCVAISGDTIGIENGVYRVKGTSEPLGNVSVQQRFSAIDSAVFAPEVFGSFPSNSPYHQWTIKTFGPLYVPRNDDCIPIDTMSIYLYKNLIEYETGQKITICSPDILLNDSIIDKYTFRQNYYFMAGDYVFDSQDSRYWGLLPEDHIVGKAILIWKSVDPDTKKVRWKREFKIL